MATKKKRVGRPREQRDARSASVTVKLTESEARKIERLARKHATTKSSWARELLLEALASH